MKLSDKAFPLGHFKKELDAIITKEVKPECGSKPGSITGEVRWTTRPNLVFPKASKIHALMSSPDEVKQSHRAH